MRTDNHIDIRGKHGEELEALFRKAVAERVPSTGDECAMVAKEIFFATFFGFLML